MQVYSSQFVGVVACLIRVLRSLLGALGSSKACHVLDLASVERSYDENEASQARLAWQLPLSKGLALYLYIVWIPSQATGSSK